MLVRGKTPSLMVGHGSVRHSPNLEGLAVHVLVSLSLSPQEEEVCTVLCCENKHVGWHSLGNLDPESARSRESNLVSVCTELEFVGYTRFRHAEVFVGVRYRTHVLRSCHQYVIIPT